MEEQRHRYRQRQLCGAGGAARRLHRARRISGKILISYGVSLSVCYDGLTDTHRKGVLMEDAQIIDHFSAATRRPPRRAGKYEKRCLAAARYILPDDRDAEGVRQRRVAPSVERYSAGASPVAGGVYHHRHPPPGPGQVRL